MKAAWQILIFVLPFTASAQFYYPDSKNYGVPSDYGLKYEDVYFESSDGTGLHGWHIQSKSKEKLGTIIHLHGNAQNISSHLRGVAWLPAQGFDVFMFDYRGYGRSKGSPSRQGVFDDCMAAIRKIQELSPNEENFIVYGQSLGAANALAVVGEIEFEKIDGVVAEAPFYSYQSIAKDKVDGLLNSLAGVVISNKKSPHLVVQDISPIPILFIHGTADRVVPVSHSRKLYEQAGQPKTIWEVQNARHLGIFHSSVYRNRLINVLKQWIEQSEEKTSDVPTN